MKKQNKPNNKNSNVVDDKKSLTNLILGILSSSPQKLFNYKQLSAILNRKTQDSKDEISGILNELKHIGTIEEVYRGKYRFKSKTGIIEGVVDISRRGYAKIISEDLTDDIFVSQKNLHNALHGDKVKVVLYAKKRTYKLEGEVIEILKRFRDKFAGTIEIVKSYGFLIPDDLRMPYDIYIPIENLNGAKSGDKVLVSITEWHPKGKNPTGTVVRILGRPGENDAEMHSILAEFGLPIDFPKDVEAAAEKIREEISQFDEETRKDFRNILTFTIDPADAKDFDDAISFQINEDATYNIGVHIADVSYYVTHGSTVDEEARNRATSIYLVDRVVPMLPEKLSNKVCSLRPKEDKLCFSAVFKINKEAEISDSWFGRTIINSDYRFDYAEVQKILDTQEGSIAEELKKVNDIAKKLREKRFHKGSFNFEHAEVKFNLDEKGKPLSVYFKEATESNHLIEEFMLLANKKVAELIGKAKRTMVYRVHDEPNPEKLQSFAGFIRRFGHQLPTGNPKKLSQSLNALINDVQGKPEQNIVESLAVRSMAKAEYSIDNIGHYGLAFDYYTHFTSPIRRYPDLMVHRLLAAFLKNEKTPKDNYEWLCKHSSDMEQLATQAERASIKYKQAEFLSDKIGTQFEGVISGVTEWGFFVELTENACEGLVPMRSLTDDFYYFDEDNYCIKGKSNGKMFMLGDKVKIEIVKVNLQKKQVDMDLVE